MSKKATEFQLKIMSRGYRGKGIFKPINTGRIDELVRCVREYAANIFFYTKEEQTIMLDAGYNYPRLKEKMKWLDLDPAKIKDILITHQDTDHVGAVENLKPDATKAFVEAVFRRGRLETGGIEIENLLPNVPLFGAAAEDRASLRQRVVEKLQTLFDRLYVL